MSLITPRTRSSRSTQALVVTSPAMMATPVLTMVSQATRAYLSWAMMASSTASEIWSAILSGWPSETDSEVKTEYSLMSLSPYLTIRGSNIIRRPLQSSLRSQGAERSGAVATANGALQKSLQLNSSRSLKPDGFSRPGAGPGWSWIQNLKLLAFLFQELPNLYLEAVTDTNVQAGAFTKTGFLRPGGQIGRVKAQPKVAAAILDPGLVMPAQVRDHQGATVFQQLVAVFK